MSARNLTYRPAAQSTAAVRPLSDGGWRVVFPPAAGSHNPRSRETTRVTPFANLHIGSFANYSLKFSFSAKERDTETGLSYFGARYYSSDLSVWLSVDPMSGKYPSLSPYTYCADNPVKLVDPNGEDWFENELTGDIYYSRDYRKGDENLIDGEGWKWMGENGMFGKSADDVITDNLDKADVFTQGDSYDRVGFSGKNAKDFMSNMGYDLRPSKVEVSIVQYQQTVDYSASGAPNYTYEKFETEQILSTKYVPKDAIGSYTIQNQPKYTDKQLSPHIRKTMWNEIRKYEYSNSNSTKFRNILRQNMPKILETISKMF